MNLKNLIILFNFSADFGSKYQKISENKISKIMPFSEKIVSTNLLIFFSYDKNILKNKIMEIKRVVVNYSIFGL